MKCRRAFDADLAAVLRGDADEADFLAHYPTCADCAAEVQVWRELDGMLRVGAPAGAAHPDPEVLLAFADAPTTLADGVRSAVELHLAACRVCTDEVRTLARFDPTMLAVATAAAPAATVAASAAVAAAPAPRAAGVAMTTPSETADAPRAGGWLGRVVWHPAFAYALVAVLLLPLLRDQLWRLPTASRVMQAERDEVRQAPASSAPLAAAPAPAAPAPPPPPAALAESEDAADGAGGFHDLTGPLRSRHAEKAAAPETVRSKARVAADADARKDDADPAKRMAPAQAAPPEMALEHREQRDDELAAAEKYEAVPQPKAAPQTGGAASQRRAAPEQEDAVAPDAGIAARDAAPRPETALASRARGNVVVSGAGPQPEAAAGKLPGESAAGAIGGAGGAIIEVRTGAPTVIPFAIAEGGVRLRFVPPEDFVVGSLTIQLRSRAGGHTLATSVTDRADAIEVQIRPRWLEPGDYEVALFPVEDQERSSGTTNSAAILHFTVSPPVPAAIGR